MKDLKTKQIRIFIFFLMVVFIVVFASSLDPWPTSKTADVDVWVNGVVVSDELLISYDIPIDNEDNAHIKRYESKPGWKFITLNLWVHNSANEIREYSNCWIETKDDVHFRLYIMEKQDHIVIAGTNSYSILPVELKPDEGIITEIVVQVPSNEDISDLYLVYTINGDDIKYSEFGSVKLTHWYYYILAYIYR